jgi:hypothetical protein
MGKKAAMSFGSQPPESHDTAVECATLANLGQRDWGSHAILYEVSEDFQL